MGNKNDCQKWCETRSFSPGSGCQFVKATNICGITYSCGTIGVAPTHFGGSCTSGDGREILYSITGGDEGGIFSMDRVSGKITTLITYGIDFETARTSFFDLKITATDKDGLSTTGDFRIAVGDVNEAPGFVDTYTASIRETVGKGWTFGKPARAYEEDNVVLQLL